METLRIMITRLHKKGIGDMTREGDDQQSRLIWPSDNR
jgi:hypothetical protein